MDLFERWKGLFTDADGQLVRRCFEDIEKMYNETSRHYHNLVHIEQLLELSDQYQSAQNKMVVDLAIFYHDVIYVAGRNDNEAESAAFASGDLQKLGVEMETIEKVVQYILATKDHFSVQTNDNDLKYFLDFDLGILSAEPTAYREYAKQIRKEYAAIPDVFYNAGRISFLKKSLDLPHIYFTEAFRKKETQAKANLEWEIRSLEQG